jgi:hypothetical protein
MVIRLRIKEVTTTVVGTMRINLGLIVMRSTKASLSTEV